MRKIILENKLSLGDVVVSTAVFRDIHRKYPGEFQLDYRGTASEIFDHNPNIHKFGPTEKAETITLKYPAIHESNWRMTHFIEAYHEFLSDKLEMPIPVTEFKGDIHLSEEEKQWTNQVQSITKYEVPFWIIVSGGKYDFTCKWWDNKKYQKVVDDLKGDILFVQVGANDHHHPPLKGAIDLRGKTDNRQLVRLVYHSSGVVCPVTGIMHMAAAIPTKNSEFPVRPCVVIAGGREPVSWEHYPSHQFLHTQGMLPCCRSGGCWKSRVEPRNDGSGQDSSLCSMPVASEGGVIIPKCMDMITSDDVVTSVRKYINGGASPTVNEIIWSDIKQYLT